MFVFDDTILYAALMPTSRTMIVVMLVVNPDRLFMHMTTMYVMVMTVMVVVDMIAMILSCVTAIWTVDVLMLTTMYCVMICCRHRKTSYKERNRKK